MFCGSGLTEAIALMLGVELRIEWRKVVFIGWLVD